MTAPARHDPVGPRAVSVYDEAAALVRRGDVDLVTCDVFDTLLARPAARPHHLFRVLGERVVAAGLVPAHVDAPTVMAARIRAERAARSLAMTVHGVAECTLEEIWAQMPAMWRPEAGWEALVAIELDVERDHLSVIPAAAELLALVTAHGVPVTLVSDTYLSVDQLTGLLDHAGVAVEPAPTVVTSSAARQNKLGGLIADVIADAGISTHMARALDGWSDDEGTDGGSSAVTRSLLLATGARGDEVGPLDPAYEFGVRVAGPLLTGFADWVVPTVRELDVRRVHYLLREGAVLAEVVAAARPDAPAATLVHASRWVFLRAAVVSGSLDELFRAVARRAMLRAEHVADAFDLDRDAVAGLIGAGPFDDERRIEALQRLVDDDAMRTSIVASSAALRARLLRYLDGVLEPEDGRLVLCDIGWGGTIQAALSDLLVAEGRDVEVVGLYLMLSTPGEDRVAAGHRMLGFLPTAGADRANAEIVMRTPEIAEQMCTPDIGTMTGLDADDRPVLAAVTDGAVASRAAVRRGILDAATERRKRFPAIATSAAPPSMRRRRALLDGFAGTIDAPGRRLALELASWEHDDVAGTGVDPLVHLDRTGILRYANAADADLIGMRDQFWLQGAAAVANPALAAQFEARRAGVDVEALCPESDLGPTLIAVFEPGSLDAVAQAVRTPRRNLEGWMLLRLTATVGRVRDVRIDVGSVDALVDIDLVRIEAVASGRTVDVTSADDGRLRWHHGFPISRTSAAVRAGGFVTVSLDGDEQRFDDTIEVTVAFRGRPLGPGESADLSPTARHRLRRIQASGRRVRSGVGRLVAPNRRPASP